MRPNNLINLFASVECLSGVGGRVAKTLQKLGIQRLLDLIFHLPSGINSYPLKPNLQACKPHETVALEVTVQEHLPRPSDRQPYKVVCVDSQGMPLHLTYFHVYKSTVQKQLPPGSKKLVAGELDIFMGQFQMPHPEKVWPATMAPQWREVEPTYPLTAGIGQAQMQKFIRLALEKLPDLSEWLPAALVTQRGWTSWKNALLTLHNPVAEHSLNFNTPHRERLAFDELLSDQVALRLISNHNKKAAGTSRVSAGQLQDKILEGFGHPLTGSQESVLQEIREDLSVPHRMTRLLQGDVGSGKTLVAVLSMAHVVEAGNQGALLVPTEILAQQHFSSLRKLTEGVGLRVELLTGRIKGKKRQEIYEALKAGEIDIIVGTHALIQDPVEFQSLGLVVIDEQHRFGVEQRAKLTRKGQDVDILVMTATPIPRTLSLTSYGDLDVSLLKEKPLGRKEITTRVIHAKKLPEAYEGLRRVLERGEKIYWVCPLVEESEALDLAAATERCEDLKKWFGDEAVGLIHGQMKGEEKDAAMARFKDGNCQILVSTTVIEVGVDVPQATVMIIEHAERFGLSQLHQLRGRVGRNDLNCSCLLIYEYPISEAGKARLNVMRESNDGFHIAEEDLRLRGAGDVLGTKQSGLPDYQFADLFSHGDLLREANQLAGEIIAQDPHLQGPHGEALRTLLYLFNHDKTAPLLKMAA